MGGLTVSNPTNFAADPNLMKMTDDNAYDYDDKYEPPLFH